jgi:hypothetical protein
MTSMCKHLPFRLAALALILPAAASTLPAQTPRVEQAPYLQDIHRDTRWLSSFATRVVGSAPHQQALTEMIGKVRALPDVKVWELDVPVVMPKTSRGELTVDQGPMRGTHRVYPVYPAGARPCTTGAEGIQGRCVYVGQGLPHQRKPRSLRGQIAVMEVTGRHNWQGVWNDLPAAIVLLGSDEMDSRDATSHILRISANVPRFFVPEGPLAQALREGRIQGASLNVDVQWKAGSGKCILALVLPEGGGTGRRALALGAQFDAMSFVPDLAPGADAAVDSAMMLNLLRHYSRNRPDKPLLFVFFDAFGIDQKGVRETFLALSPENPNTRSSREDQQDRLEQYRRDARLCRLLEQTGDALAHLSDPKFASLHPYIRDEAAREVIEIETQMHPLRLAQYDAQARQDPGLQEKIDRLALRRTQFFQAEKALLEGNYSTDVARRLAKGLWQQARQRIETQYAQTLSWQQRFEAHRKIRREVLSALEIHDPDSQVVGALLAVDLSDAGVAAGMTPMSSYWGQDDAKPVEPFRQWLDRVLKEEKDRIWTPQQQVALNTVYVGKGGSLSEPVVGTMPAMTGYVSNYGLTGVTWTTTSAPRIRLDTPIDTFDRLDWSRLDPQIMATTRLIERMAVSSENLDWKPPVPLALRYNRIDGLVVDRSPGEPVPRLPMGGFLACIEHGVVSGGRAGLHWMEKVPGIRRQDWQFTGADGRFLFPTIHSHMRPDRVLYYLQSFKVEDDGRITRALDYKKAGKGLRLNTNIRGGTQPLRGVVFSCEGVSAVEFFDPRFLSPLTSLTVLDARRGTEPQRMNLTSHRGVTACFLETGVKWQFILRAGITRNRMALLNVRSGAVEEPLKLTDRQVMAGFPTFRRTDYQQLHQSAIDLYRLDYMRLAKYSKAGIHAQPIRKLQQKTDDLLAEAREALEADDGRAYYAATASALSNEIRAYQAVRDTASDVTRGAVFLLLMLVPFAWILERLVYATPHIYKQIGASLGIFTVMALVLMSFHPAFEISGQPMMIVMAFAIIFMSLLVISVIYSKFESGLTELRSGHAETAAAKTSRGGVVLTAFRLGIANMRKRKLRTFLTAVTVVLITFSLLCFMSTSNYTGSREYDLDQPAGFTGVLVRQPGWRRLAEQSRIVLGAYVGEEYDLTPRYWLSGGWSGKMRFRVRSRETGKDYSFSGGLGLSGAEGDLTGLRGLLDHWDVFADTGGIYLPVAVAEQMDLRPRSEQGPGDILVFAGKDLELLGTFDPGVFDETVRDMENVMLTPLDTAGVDRQRRALINQRDVDVMAGEMASGVGLEDSSSLPRHSSRACCIVPAEIMSQLEVGALQSLAAGTKDFTSAQDLARRLSGLVAQPVYYGQKGQPVSVIASTPMAPSAPKSILVPLLIGGLMIFNTMLSSIAERKREVYIYTSIGLAPLHVAVLFLAEAVTYGLMGSVFGYVAGQAVATVLGDLGLLGGLTLNYSGTHAIAVMLMVMAVVILSSLVPAYLAGKLAAPSNEMSWKVPEPVHDTITDELPFTVTGRGAHGVLMYLFEYFDIHKEGAVGHFSTDDLRVFGGDETGPERSGVEATVWLAPYDLGVRQHVRLTLHPTDEEEVFAMEAQLIRGSGQLGSFHQLNRKFLGDLRKQMLGWRRLSTRRVMQYIKEGEQLLEEAAEAQADQREQG